MGVSCYNSPIRNIGEIMFINQNSLEYKHFKDFEKYAKFICEKFDVNVQLESTRAETDGKTIYLPNILSMTAKELDMMYAILLHEAGHIRYSTFDESYFSKLKTQWHAFLANAIEDARIENLLLNDFGGAKEIFTNLYTVYTQDKKLMKKVFKHDGEKPDLFTTMSFNLHNQMVNFETSELKEISGVRIANRIVKFFDEAKINELIVSNYPKKPNDVIDFTNEVYDRFFSYFKKKDTSQVVNFKKEVAEKKELEDIFNKIKEEALKIEEKVKELRSKADEISHEINNFEGLNAEKLQELNDKIGHLSSEKEKIDYQIKWKSEYDNTKKNLSSLPEEISKLEQDRNNQTAEKKALQEKLEGGLTGRGKEFTEEQKKALQEKIEIKKRQEERIQNKINQKIEEQKAGNSHMSRAEKEMAENSSMCNKNFDIEQAVANREKITSELNDAVNNLKEMQGKKKELESKKEEVLSQIKNMQNNFAEQVADKMFEVDKMAKNLDVDMGILPEMNYEDVWPEAAQEQELFDSKASKEMGRMVRNGQKGAGLFGTNVRDILVFIDKKKEKVEEIDVLAIFKDKIHASKLDDLNNDLKVDNYMEDRSIVGVYGTKREHIPFTTEFDSVKKDNMKKNFNLYSSIVKDNIGFHNDVKRVIAKNFKFSKKDFWRGAQEEGSLDVRNLWKLPTRQGDDFYEVSNPRYENKVAVSILVDISGSQNKDATEYGKKIQSLVIALSNALTDVHVKHEVLGFHAPVSDELRQMNASGIYTRRANRLESVVYKDFNQKDSFGVANMELQMSDNSDGESLRIAIKRLKAVRAKSHLLFFIGDGKPFLSDTDISVLDEDFRSALRMAVREKVQIYGVGFFEQLGLFFGERFCNASKNEDFVKFLTKINA